jgi:hypothetical protein
VGISKEKLFQVNTALKACMDTLYGSEMNQRRLAENREQKKATSGESGGAHERGCEELIPLLKEDEMAWGRSGMVFGVCRLGWERERSFGVYSTECGIG